MVDKNISSERLSVYIGNMAAKAILYEVSAAPKPGLVDRMDAGAHEDMDYFTFLDSIMAIGDDFRRMAEAGTVFKGSELRDLFAEIREIGKGTEKIMLAATDGVNTHKGIIFSMGILSALAGFLMVKKGREKVAAEELCSYVPMMVGDLCHELKHIPNKRPLTHGEKLYKKYGVTGIRGEVSSGFSTVLATGIPTLRRLQDDCNTDQLLVSALLSIMSKAEDSNVLHRHGMDGLEYVRKTAAKAIELGGPLTKAGSSYLLEMEADFKRKKISPGGGADLLAVSVFLRQIETGKDIYSSL